MRIEFGEQGELRDGEIELTIVMRGDPTAVVRALTDGLPDEAKIELADALTMECRRRQLEPAAAFAEERPLSAHARAVRAEMRLKDGSQ